MITFILLTLFVVISPGIDTALVTKTAISHGQQAGYKTALGITTGSLVHTLAAALGLSAIIMQSAVAFNVIKWVGALYLIYLGVSAFIQLGQKKGAQPKKLSIGGSPFKQGLLTNLLNPKVAVFFLTFLPQFVTNEGSAIIQLLAMGLTYAVLSILWFILYVFFIGYVREWLMSPIIQSRIEKATGIVLIGFGLKLALDN
ncbi:LysE family translocator [Solibacillus sp. FSL H8-0538]|uniref:LysE family translocator n=1 Tax=Solibacillus sp. FSL H8-0538 TaxID=2921400 RepID=UPI0030F889EB